MCMIPSDTVLAAKWPQVAPKPALQTARFGLEFGTETRKCPQRVDVEHFLMFKAKFEASFRVSVPNSRHLARGDMAEVR